ncbi:MAG: hypothetical protein WD469_06615 [Paenibacillaceae bacterium]
MRMGTFLLGGIVGAIAVSYMNRNNGMMMANLANAGQSVGRMVTQAKSKFSNMNSNMSMDKSSESADLPRVQEILNKDPELKTKVDEILAENQDTASSLRMQ